MGVRYDCSVEAELLSGMRLARQAIGRGECILMPTDTVYGIAADAFTPEAVQRLFDAKGRGRQTPPPVLIPSVDTLAGLAVDVPAPVRALAEAFWPGGLTIIFHAQPSLQWDLGESRGTVALRVPDHSIARALLEDTGPLAVTSANRTGERAAVTASEAEEALGAAVSVILDAGPVGGGYAPVGERPGDLSSTIIDATGFDDSGTVRVVRAGVITRERLAEVLGPDCIAAPEAP